MLDVSNHSTEAVAEPSGSGDASLREATFRGVRWVVLARIGAETFAFAAAVVLARLVSPAEFGRAVVPLAIVPLAVILTFEGCASALVQRKTVTRTDRDSAVMMSVLAGLLMTALTFVLAEPLGGRVFSSRVAGLIELVSPVFVLASVGAVPRALMWRRLDFRRVSIVEVISLAIGSAVSVGLALGGFGAEAIIGGALAGTAASSLMLFVASPFALRTGTRAAARGIAGFGVPAALAGLVHVAYANTGPVILAARLTPSLTGLYWRGFQLGVAYQEKISGVMLRMAYPVYSRTTNAAELRHVHERATRLHATVIAPLLALLIVVAPVLIPWLLGPAWNGAIVPTQILAVAGMIAAVLTGYPQVMLAVGKPRQLLQFNAAMLALNIVVVLITSSHGLKAVCLGVVGVHVVILAAVYSLLLRPYVGVPIRRLFTDLAPAVIGAGAVFSVGFPLRAALAGASPFLTLVAIGVFGGIAYLATICVLFPAARADLVLVVTNLLPPALRRRGRRGSSSLAAVPPTPR